jgi:hypothetical protein
MTRFTRSVALLGTVSIGGCDVVGSTTRTEFDELFPEVVRVSLEDDVEEPLAEITSLTPRSDGGFIVVDGISARVLEYDSAGRLERVRGKPGRGPGELRSPSAAVEGPSGELHVVEHGSPRHTVFWSADSVSIGTLPGHYGYSLHRVAEGLIVGIGTEEERFAFIPFSGGVHVRFARRDPRIAEIPFWIFFARERASVADARVFVSSSFSPIVQVFSTSGNPIDSIGVVPSHWTQPTRPPVDALTTPDDRARLEAWARSFTVVTGLAATDNVLVVQYGQHDPLPNAPTHVVRERVDVYSMGGEKLVEGVELRSRLLSGGSHLYLLESEPPGPWTVSVRRWSGHLRSRARRRRALLMPSSKRKPVKSGAKFRDTTLSLAYALTLDRYPTASGESNSTPMFALMRDPRRDTLSGQAAVPGSNLMET